VATQLVEAGVDVDFPVVYRALAGVDALAQAAGRCNREGKLTGLGELRIFRAATEPPPGVLQTALGCTESLLAELGGELELFEPEIYRRFFRRLYASVPLDKNDIQELRRSLRFKTVAGSFKMIEDDWSAAIVLPYAGGAKLIAELEAAGPSRDLLRRLQRYTIAMPKRRRDEWLDDGRARWIDDTLVALGSGQEHLYDQRFGLDAEEGGPSLVV